MITHMLKVEYISYNLLRVQSFSDISSGLNDQAVFCWRRSEFRAMK